MRYAAPTLFLFVAKLAFAIKWLAFVGRIEWGTEAFTTLVATKKFAELVVCKEVHVVVHARAEHFNL